MKRIALPLLLAASLAGLLSSTGCRGAKYKLGLETRVDNPDEGTPEATLQFAFRAAMDPNELTGWAAFEKVLHSEQKNTHNSISEWREMRFARLRKQWNHYIQDAAKASFDIENEIDFEDGGIEFYIENGSSDLPTPCMVKPDFDGVWRITRCSL